MSSHNRSQSSARRSDYVWQYEYYDEEPVSFEGLKAHRYSIVIGFWVGLAVFVIFMFFLLLLLTKTGAPHQENPDFENIHGPRSGLVDISAPRDDNHKAFCRPFLPESRSYFNFYISEAEESKRRQKPEETQTGSPKAGSIPPEAIDQEDPGFGIVDERTPDRDCVFLSHFNIPNFINFEHSSSLGDDLLCETPGTLDQNQHDPQSDIH
ncbi:melanocortin-2 receptor accessory protein 2-like [Nerophis lumbriciformis]|uniref:melanocortin-2 receptor accessory protein 2-like n=1 Tax=Nerophis lumbriciformis TaxID=546530 RepID=UPI002AE05EBF|nr:melanocortin-2 receptor accessory protein 2-like [Nerophis lumbriciformis]